MKLNISPKRPQIELCNDTFAEWKCEVFGYESETFHRRRPNGISHCENGEQNPPKPPLPLARHGPPSNTEMPRPTTRTTVLVYDCFIWKQPSLLSPDREGLPCWKDVNIGIGKECAICTTHCTVFFHQHIAKNDEKISSAQKLWGPQNHEALAAVGAAGAVRSVLVTDGQTDRITNTALA